MSARSLAASWAQKRAIANPFQQEIPTSLPNDFDTSRIRSTSASSPGTISAVPMAAGPVGGGGFFPPRGPRARGPPPPRGWDFGIKNPPPPPPPPAVLTKTAERPSASGEGKRTRSEPDSCSWRRRVTPSTWCTSNVTEPWARLAAKISEAAFVVSVRIRPQIFPKREHDLRRSRYKLLRAPSGG